MLAATSAGENPYTAPPTAAAVMLAPHHLSTQNKLAADPAKPTTSSRFKLVNGPASSVIGASTTPGSSIDAFHIRLMPCGAFSPVVTSDRRRTCENGGALIRMTHA